MDSTIFYSAQLNSNNSVILLVNNTNELDAFSFSKEEKTYLAKQEKKEIKSICINRFDQYVFIEILGQDKEKARLRANTLHASIISLKLESIDILDLSQKKSLGFYFAEGLALSNYQFLKYFTKDKANSLKKIHLVSDNENKVKALQAMVEGTLIARDLVNEPLSYLTALQYSKDMEALSSEVGLKVEVLHKKKIETLKMGGLLAVNKGSIDPPTFTIMEWSPKNASNKKPIVLVGKGIVYDTGGLSLKPTANSMDIMKCDMGGSAAVVSAGSAIASLGSDTGGSIRQPASFCGVVGFKPTYGTVSRFGLVAFASSLDQIGPITNHVEDARLIFNSMKGHDPRDATSLIESKAKQPKLKNAKIGIIKELMEDGISEDAKKEVHKVAKLLEAEGHEIIEVSLPLTKMSISIYYLIAPAECSANLSRFDGVRYGNRVPGSTSSEMMELTRANGFGPEVKKRILLGTYALSAGYYDAYYGQALKARAMMKKEFTDIYEDVDYLISPTSPSDPFKFGEKSDNQLEMYMSDLCTIPANLVGMPAISIPTGLSSQGLPLSVQIMSPSNTDNTLLDFSESLESLVAFTEEPVINGVVS